MSWHRYIHSDSSWRRTGGPNNLPGVFHAYMLRSERNPKRLYCGFTADLRARLQSHNEGANHSTRDHRPWAIAWYAGFETEHLARSFEAYLQTASGKAFARKRLLGAA